MSLLATWQNAQSCIRNQIGESSYQSWFSHLNVLTHENTLIIETPDEFFKNWIEDHFIQIIKNAISKQGTIDCSIKVIVNSRLNITTSNLPSTNKEIQPVEIIHKTRSMNLQPRFNFDNFVMGPSNQFAFKASQAVAENPAKAYNPLFIYGQSGMGKTHLMQSIANYIINRNPNLACSYITSEQFTNELIEAIKNKSAAQFKQKFRHVDVLLIDDIHFIAGKESTQEEFFHTFNDLHNAHKQIVMTSDRPAKELAKMEDRLVTRFSWGLTVDIQPPNFETRVAILRKKIEVEEVRVHIPDEVIFFIAEQIKTNIRELEGALIRVVACSLLDDKPINLSVTQNVLKDMVNASVKIISLEMIMSAVAEYYSITVSELKSTRRNQTIVLPRQISMYLARKLTRHSLPTIGNSFGGRDHTTVLHSCNKIESLLTVNKEIKFAIDKLIDVLSR